MSRSAEYAMTVEEAQEKANQTGQLHAVFMCGPAEEFPEIQSGPAHELTITRVGREEIMVFGIVSPNSVDWIDGSGEMADEVAPD